MTVRALDINGDIVTSGTQFLSSQAEIAQTIKTRLNLFLGEYFRDITDGTAWFQKIFTKQTSLANKEAVIKSRILNTEGVLKLTSFTTDFDLSTRAYTVTVGVLTQYGADELQIDGNF